jgi:hypothetical protein
MENITPQLALTFRGPFVFVVEASSVSLASHDPHKLT